jgi:hypothetical protein
MSTRKTPRDFARREHQFDHPLATSESARVSHCKHRSRTENSPTAAEVQLPIKLDNGLDYFEAVKFLYSISIG